MTRRRLLLLASLALTACGSGPQDSTALLADGVYQAISGGGYAPADEASVLATTARLDHAAGTLTLTLSDGSQKVLTYTPRDSSRWPRDCVTNTAGVRDETADLTPAPLVIASLTLQTPVAYAKCGPNRMILADVPEAPTDTYLVLDHQP